MKNVIESCVIGSYPIDIDPFDLMINYFDQRNINWNEYIAEVAKDLTNAGINIITDGQTRDSMVEIFTRKLDGCRIRKRAEIVGKIEYKKPITLDDQKFLKKIIPQKYKIKTAITGPFTLTKSCVDFFYNNEKETAFDFAKALKKEVNILQNYVDFISIDEPFYSNLMPEYAKELIKIITHNIKCPTTLHVCGDITKIIPDIIEIPVDILSHEFKASPHLFEEFIDYDFRQALCVGSVRSDSSKIESVEEITDHIKKAIDLFGNKVIQISPDCGQRFLSRSVAFQKLKNLAKAGELINGG